MIENEVNIKVKEWLLSKGFHYKGILNLGKGQVLVPDGARNVLIDHMGVRDNSPISQVWIEAKGGDCGMSMLLQGFIRVAYAVWHGGGTGYLAIPNKEFEIMKEQSEFLKSVSESVNGIGQMGILDAESGKTIDF